MEATKDQKITALESTFDEPAAPAEPAKKERSLEDRLRAHYADVPITYWGRCPIKSRLTGTYQLIEVDFDDRCPSALRCLVMPEVEAGAKSLTGHIDLPEGWTDEDAESHNARSRKAEPKVISVVIPTIKLGTTCAGCTRGGSTGLDSEQGERQERRVEARTERAAKKEAQQLDPSTLTKGDCVKISDKARTPFKGQTGLYSHVDDNGYMHISIGGQGIAVSLKNMEVVS